MQGITYFTCHTISTGAKQQQLRDLLCTVWMHMLCDAHVHVCSTLLSMICCMCGLYVCSVDTCLYSVDVHGCEHTQIQTTPCQTQHLPCFSSSTPYNHPHNNTHNIHNTPTKQPCKKPSTPPTEHTQNLCHG